MFQIFMYRTLCFKFLCTELYFNSSLRYRRFFFYFRYFFQNVMFSLFKTKKNFIQKLRFVQKHWDLHLNKLKWFWTNPFCFFLKKNLLGTEDFSSVFGNFPNSKVFFYVQKFCSNAFSFRYRSFFTLFWPFFLLGTEAFSKVSKVFFKRFFF